MPKTEQLLKSFLYKSFNRDSVLAAAMEASFNVTPLYAPMVERRGSAADYAGSEALSILVPNVGALPWEVVVEYREHRGSAQARARLREFEQLAAEEEPQDAYDFLKKVSREVNRAYQAAIEDLAPSCRRDLAEGSAAHSHLVISVIGPVIERVAAVAGSASESPRVQRVLDRRPYEAAERLISCQARLKTGPLLPG